jgi:hypothetical protein
MLAPEVRGREVPLVSHDPEPFLYLTVAVESTGVPVRVMELAVEGTFTVYARVAAAKAGLRVPVLTVIPDRFALLEAAATVTVTV